MRGRAGIARSVTDGRQQLDRRESDAIIAGQLAFAMIIGDDGGWGRGGGRGSVPRDALARGQHHMH